MHIEYLKERAQAMGAKVIEIYERNVQNNFNDYFPVFTVSESQDVQTELTSFGRNFRGVFTALLRREKGQAKNTGERVVFTVYNEIEETQPRQAAIAGHHGHETPEQMREALRKEMARELEVEMLKAEILELRRGRAKNEVLHDRLESSIFKVMDKLGWFENGSKAASHHQPINGGTTNGTSEAKYGPHNLEDLSDSDLEEMNEEMAILYSYLGKENTKKLSQAIQDKPNLVDYLKML